MTVKLRVLNIHLDKLTRRRIDVNGVGPVVTVADGVGMSSMPLYIHGIIIYQIRGY